MKRIAIALLTSAAVAVGFSQLASAAELPVRAAPPPPAPAPAPAPTWTGLYVGVHGGGAWESTPNWSVVDQGTLAPIGLTAWRALAAPSEEG